MNWKDRIRLTSSCNDCEIVPKIKTAGQVFIENNIELILRSSI